ncbi:lipopolysaccharide biosynthesis protein [Atopomonas hussainii]|uniref:lipopolysaccharide biosynthesis protein n=1 Tax=Atopomonas hussainii TaxID=1429083 RepID=UPI0008FFF31C|nr:oligosaccharide flippase family protein [Atopomonas hussainii]
MNKKNLGLFLSSIFYGVGGAIPRVISFILLPVFTSYLTPLDYGVLGLLVALPAILLPVFSVGLSASIGVCYFAVEDQACRRNIISTSRAVTYISSVVMLVITVFALDWVTAVSVGSLEYRLHVLVAIATVVLNVLCLPLQLEQQFSGRPKEYVAVSLAGVFFSSLCSLILVVIFEVGSIGPLVGSLLGQAVSYSLLMYSGKERLVGGEVDWQIGMQLLKHGMPMLPSFVFLFVIQSGVRWPLEWRHGMEQVGLYSLGTSLGSVMALFTTGVVTAWMPWVMAQSSAWKESRNLVARRFTQYFMVGSFLVLLFFCFAQPALHLLTSHEFYDAWRVVGLVAASNFMVAVFSLVLPPVYMAKKVPLILISQGISAAVAVACMYYFLVFGILGAAFSVFLASVVLVVVQLFVNFKLTNIEPIPLDFYRLGIFLALLIFCCGATFFLDAENFFHFSVRALGLLSISGCLLLAMIPGRAVLLERVRELASRR